jgi:hypothetical protein
MDPGPTTAQEGTRYDLPLLPHHERLLIESAINPDVARARGYRSVQQRTELRRLGFGEAQARTPALLIPVYGVTGELVLYQLRPDKPRIVDGRAVKYETPRGARMVLDVPPTIRTMLGDPAVPLFITEGVRKADAATSKGLCCVALLGVWNFRGTNAHGGKVALPDFELIALNDREVFIVFDSDVMLKSAVHAALARLAEFLRSRGARVRFIYFEPGTSGVKVGLDDFFAQERSVADLFALATATLRPCADADSPEAPLYTESPDGLVYLKPTQHGPVPVPLTNFTAHIVEEIVEDDGTADDPHRLLKIEAHVAGRTLCFTIPASRFAAMTWVTEHLSVEALVRAGIMVKDHTRAAIQMLSVGVTKRRRYTHTGWRIVDGAPVYLHGGGAIGADGVVPDVEVSLPDALAPLTLPAPPVGPSVITAVRASLQLLDLAPLRLTVPLFAAIWRAVLRAADFGLHLVGATGVFKTAVAALVQAHWGAGFDHRHLPAAWSGTANALEGLAFVMKDAILVVDDFAPGGTVIDVARAHRDADRLFRAQGNQAGRQRMRADTTLRPPKPPRGLVLSTGEDTPRGQSLRARVLILEVAPGDIAIEALTFCQTDAAAGRYAEALAGYVAWVAARYNELWATWATDLSRLRLTAMQADAHPRTPDIVAELAMGMDWFLRFAEEIGVLTHDEVEARWSDVWAALVEAASEQQHQQVIAEPAAAFLDLLGGALVGGHAHLAGPDGRAPANPRPWGWREYEVGVGDSYRTEWRPQGDQVGWVDGDNLYLKATAAYTAVQRYGRASGEGLSVGLLTLKKRLHEKGLLLSVETRGRKQRLEVRRTIDGKRHDVLHLAVAVLAAEEVAQVAQEPLEPRTPDGSADASRATLWATRDSEVAQQVAHGRDPNGGVHRPPGPLGPPPSEDRKLPADPGALDRPSSPGDSTERHSAAGAQGVGDGTDPLASGSRESTATHEPGEDDPLLALAAACGWPCVPLRRGLTILGIPADWRTFAATASPSDRSAAQHYLEHFHTPGEGDGDR